MDAGVPYDAKAIVGAAYGFLPGKRRPLTWDEFGSRKMTTKKWLEDIGFHVITRDEVEEFTAQRASSHLDIGNLYTRKQLKRIFSSRDATIMTGVFRPTGFRSVCLFVTEEKTADRTQYRDSLRGDVLRWQGQLSGRTDYLVAEHASRGLELLLFYRREKYEYPDAAFRYEGIFRYVRRRGRFPASFVLTRQSLMDSMERAESEVAKTEAFDPKTASDARKKVLTTIAIRRGQRKFRLALLRAYGNQCAITGCDYPEVLEAAHIYPYRGDRTNHITNGLLLRADVHTLFDLRWIAIDHKTRRTIVHPSLAATAYRDLAAKRVSFPRNMSEHPSRGALEWHLKNSRLSKA